MLDNKFKLAKPIYPLKYLDKMNISLFFVEDFSLLEDANLLISGNSLFRIFNNGKLIFYGPSRAANNYYRVNNINLKKGKYHLVIEHNSYRCNTYYVDNLDPFVQYEVRCKDRVILYSNKNSKCYLNNTRFQKVSRFSFQRGFSESYNFAYNPYLNLIKKNINLPSVKVKEYPLKNYLANYVDEITFVKVKAKNIEEGFIKIDSNKKVYDDRYMHLDFLKIFPKDDWEVNVNDLVSKFTYFKSDLKSDVVSAKQFKTYRLKANLTGFIFLKFKALEDSEIYLIFDEINLNYQNKNELIDLSFFRNTSQNIISYKLKKGDFKHLSFECYSAKYFRLVVFKGMIKDINLSLIKYENPLVGQISYRFNNSKINLIFKAGISTFAQNSVDILTDCPSRERAGWLCDSYFSGQSEFLINGKNNIEKSFLENYAYYSNDPNLPINMIPMLYPGSFPDGNFIPNWSLFYILELANYLKRTNDVDLVKQSKHNIVNLLNYFLTYENEYNLLENLSGWIFVEWSKANEFIDGVNFPSNMLYSEALVKAGELLGDGTLINKGLKLKKTINTLSFNGEFFIDNAIRDENNNLVLTTNCSETCQYYAFYFRIANKNSHQKLFEKLISEFGPNRNDKNTYPNVYKSNVFIGDYLRLNVLLDNSYSDLVYQETIDYFYNMARISLTLWEHDSPFASLNHGFTSFIINIICHMVFGLKEISYQNHEILFDNNFYPLKGEITLHLKDGILVLKNDQNKVSIINKTSLKIKYENHL